MPDYVLLIAVVFTGLSWLVYNVTFLVIARLANKSDLPAIARAMNRRSSPPDGERDDDSQKGT